MHKDAELGVIGSDGQAHNLPGLFISDASVFPTSLGVNPQLTIMAMGTFLGRKMLEGA
jgi:choline dehydrogenase-like flavoprotein